MGWDALSGIRAFWNERHRQLYLFRVREHYERLHRSCRSLYIRLPYIVDELIAITIRLLQRNGFQEDVYIRPIAYKGGVTLFPDLADPDDRLVIYCTPRSGKMSRNVLRTMVSSWTRVSDNMIPAFSKPLGAYINSALAAAEALMNGYDEAIMLTQNGDVSEGPAENLFLYRQGRLITPPVSDNILEGITRDTVILVSPANMMGASFCGMPS